MNDEEVFLKKRSARSLFGEKNEFLKLQKSTATSESRTADKTMQEGQENFFDFLRAITKKGKP